MNEEEQKGKEREDETKAIFIFLPGVNSSLDVMYGGRVQEAKRNRNVMVQKISFPGDTDFPPFPKPLCT